MTPNQILDTINPQKEKNLNLLNAVVEYCYTAAIQEKRTDGPYSLFNMVDMISRCVTNSLNLCGDYDISNDTYIAVVDQSSKTAEICKLLGRASEPKEIGNTLKSFAESIRCEKPKLTLIKLKKNTFHPNKS